MTDCIAEYSLQNKLCESTLLTSQFSIDHMIRFSGIMLIEWVLAAFYLSFLIYVVYHRINSYLFTVTKLCSNSIKRNGAGCIRFDCFLSFVSYLRCVSLYQWLFIYSYKTVQQLDLTEACLLYSVWLLSFFRFLFTLCVSSYQWLFIYDQNTVY